MPPAGPQTVLDQQQAAWLFQYAVRSKETRTMTSVGFNSIVLGRPAEEAGVLQGIASDPDGLPGALSAMYVLMQSVMNSDLPAADRAKMAYALNVRYSAFLGRLLEQPGLPAKTREKAARAKAEFLDSTVVLEELARARQTVPRLHELEKSVQAFFKQDNGGAPAHEAWRIGRPIPKSQREKNASVQELTDSLPRLAKAVESVRFKFEKFQKRWELVTTKGFSKRLQESVRKGYEEFLGEALNAIRALNSSITRVSAVSLPKGFRDPGAIEGRMRSVIWVPDNKNLRLRVKGDTAEVRVLFETDIQEDAVLAAIKASIEDYWRGEFDYGGKTMRFKTSVSIRKVQTFSPGALTLRAAVDTVAHAGQTGIVFDRDLDYPTPAHEFGHILGLNDEYTEGYRAADRTAVSRQNAGSLMGSLGGDVLPRHLKTAYQLLKRRSLEKD